MILIALLLARAGVLWALLLLLFYPLRFPKTYPLFLMVAGILFLRFWLWDQPFPELAPKGIQQLEGYVIQVRRQLAERQVAVVSLQGERVYLTYGEGKPLLLPGQQLRMVGELREPSPVRVPHAFDFPHFLRGQNIGRTLFTRELEVVGERFSPWRYQQLLSHWVGERLPPLTADYVRALFLGSRDGLDEDMQGAISDLGILHVFAISGLHVGLLSGILAYGLKRLGLMEELAQFVVIAFLVAFVFVAGGSPSILRATGMGVLAILNRRFKWRLSSLDVFSLVFLGNFLLAPYQVLQVGFIYSYWLTAVLILSKPLLAPIKGWKSWLFFPLLAQLGALPLTLYLNYEVNVWAYVANLLLVPVVTGFLIPALLVALFFPVVSLVTEPLLLVFQNSSLWLSRQFFRPWIVGALDLHLLIGHIIVFVVVCYAFEKWRKWWLWASMIGLTMLILEVNRLNPQSRITFVDVGQGDSIVLRSPRQSCTVVVDTGGEVGRGSNFSWTLEPYLLGSGVRDIDFLIVTHSDFDHYGGALPLLERFPVRNLIINDEAFSNISQSELYLQTLKRAEELGTTIQIARAGDQLACGNQRYIFLQPQRVAKDTNDSSLVKLVEMDGVHTLLTGDIGFEVESYILRNLAGRRVDIYKSAHHGSRFSNSMAFMEAVNPQLAVVQAGVNNRFGHPTQEWFDVVEALGIRQFDTPGYGTVQIQINRSGTWTVSTMLGGE